jgi:alkane 1-monooxygenase
MTELRPNGLPDADAELFDADAATAPGADAVTQAADGRRWRDPKRFDWLSALFVPLLPFGAWGLVTLTGWNAWWWFGPMWIIAFMPILDHVRGTDTSNPPEWAVPQLEADRYYRWATFLFVPLQLTSFIWGCWYVSTHDLSVWSFLGLAFTVGTVAGIAIATAHELGHKRPKVERRLAKAALAQSAYGHFYVEHNRGHHTRVSTPEDPASSRLGESFWEFLPRTIVGSLHSAWDIEIAALRRKGRRWYSPRNDILNAWAMTIVLFGAMVAIFGVGVLPFVVIQAVVGLCLLEVVNYIEHYGLLRQKLPNGRYERCLPEHSWNANNVASNVVLFHLERHSDHHAYPLRRYQSLRHFDDAPQLPSGYALMITLALVPPLWRRVMDPRVVAHYEGEVTRANIHPRVRDRILSRYAAA